MPRLSLFKPTKGNDFTFIDRIVGEHLNAGGTGVNLHKYIGVVGSDSEVYIQDVLFMENRDRKYDSTIYDLRGHYDIQDDNAYDNLQFGAFLSNAGVFMVFHIESMVGSIGRKIMPGDVLELPHLRDDLLLGQADAINRFYVVTDATRPRDGYDPGWWPHLWRVKLTNITDSQEYRDLLGTGENEDDLRNVMSTYAGDLAVNDRLLDEAETEVSRDPQYRKTGHLYFDPTVKGKPGLTLDYGGSDGIPPNGAEVTTGIQFPTSGVNEGDYFLRTDFIPNRLFIKEGSRWVKVGEDLSLPWAVGDRRLSTFINNTNTTTNSDGTSLQSA